MNYLPSNLANIRKSMQLTQEEFAQKLNINRSTYAAYEEGRAEPSLLLANAILKLCGKTLDELVNEKIQ